MKLAPLAALCTPLLACACVSLPAYEAWEERPSHPPLPATFMVVDSGGIDANCGTYRNLYVFGCAKRIVDSRACIVFTRADPQPWLIEHERKHCDGWDHIAASRDFPSGTALFASPIDALGRPRLTHSHAAGAH